MGSLQKPSEKEEEYFARQAVERMKKEAEERQGRMADDEKKRLKEQHYMHCPKCGHQLSELDYKGVKIDRCMNCHGVWLDAGELELVTQKEGYLGGFLKLFK
jgi:transposase